MPKKCALIALVCILILPKKSSTHDTAKRLAIPKYDCPLVVK
jgi:hypothetical protein